jgi:putative DNA methylase
VSGCGFQWSQYRSRRESARPLQGAASATAALPTRRGRASASGPLPFATSPLRHLLFAIRETARADNSPEPGRQYLYDTFGQGYWGQRERCIRLLDWLATLGHTAGMNEWAADSEAARILAGRLRNDQA